MAWLHKYNNPLWQSGQALVEMLLALALASLILPTILTSLVTSRAGKPQQMQRQQATALAREASDALRNIRDQDWNKIATNGTFHPVFSTAWSLSAGTENLNGFTRSVVISDVCRSLVSIPPGQIVNCGGTNVLDPSTKQLTITVSWPTPSASSVTSTIYLSRYNSDATFVQTLASDFSAGTLTGTAITNASGGEVVLGPGVGTGDWCKPAASVVATYNLPHSSVPIAISANTISQQNDYAYTTTGDNSSNGDGVDGLSITQKIPPTITNTASNSESKKNYGIFVDSTNNYVYVNQGHPNHTVRIFNASGLTPYGYFDDGNNGNEHGTSIFVVGNTGGYTTVNNKLYAFTVGSGSQGIPTGWTTPTLSGNGKRVVVVNSHAYVVTDATTNQLQIINRTTGSIIKSVDMKNGLSGIDVFVNSSETYAYVVTSYAANKNDFFIVDLTNTNNIFGFSTSGMNPTGIFVSDSIPTSKRAIIVGANGKQYQVFDVTTPSSSPGECVANGGLSPSGVGQIYGVSGVTRADGSVYSYIITDNSAAEVQMIQGGAGGASGKYVANGVFESSTFNAGATVVFNNFLSTVSTNASTAITYAFAAKAAVSGSCTSVTFANSDFVSVAPGPLPYGTTGQCARYRLYLTTTDTSQTPTLFDITFNYSL